MTDRTSSDSSLSVPVRRSREPEVYVPSNGPIGSIAAPRNVLAIMWDRLWVVLACVVLALIGGSVYLTRATSLYSSSSVLYVQQSAPKIISDDLSSGSMAAINLTTQCELITSTIILEQAARRPELAGVPSLGQSENAVGFLKSVVRAQPNKEGELIVVSVTLPSPTDAAIIVNCVVGAYIDYQSKQHQSTAVQVAGILQKEMDSHEKELNAAQQAMMAIRQENPELMSHFNKRDAGEGSNRQSDLAQQLSHAKLQANNLHLALRTAEASRSDPTRLRQLMLAYQLGDLLPPSSLAQLSAEYKQQAAQLSHLLVAGHGSSSDPVLQAQTELDHTREQMTQAVHQDADDCLRTIRTASDVADTQVQQLQESFDGDQKARLTLNAKEVEYDQLAASAERNERALDALDGRLKDIHFTEDIRPMAISVLESAKPNPFPVSPNRPSILGQALVAGLVAGLGAAMLLERLDHRLRSVDEIPALFDGPILGVIPRAIRRAQRADAGRETFLYPRSAVAEAFGTVRTAIYFGANGNADDRPLKTILVTSPAPGDGKSTCVSNLAIAVAQAGRRVLLIDADCRRPVQHKTFKLDETAGLTGVLTGNAKLADAVRRTDIDRLDVLQCGPLPHNPAELLDSQALLDLLAEASASYDQVLVDSPPVNLVSDARVLAASCDASLLVLRAERSTRRAALLAWNVLASVGARRLGVVVNDVTRASDGYGYSYYSRYGYGPYSTNGTRSANAVGGEATQRLGPLEPTRQ